MFRRGRRSRSSSECPKEYKLRRDLNSIFVDTYYHAASNNERRIIEEKVQKLWNYAHTREAFGCTWTINISVSVVAISLIS